MNLRKFQYITQLNLYSKNWNHFQVMKKHVQFISYRHFPSNVKFHLLFNTPMGSYVTENITHILKDMAPHRLKDGFELVDVGDLNLIWNRYHIDMKVTNYTMHTATDIAHTGTIDFPATQGPGKIMYCKNCLFLKFYYSHCCQFLKKKSFACSLWKGIDIIVWLFSFCCKFLKSIWILEDDKLKRLF